MKNYIEELEHLLETFRTLKSQIDAAYSELNESIVSIKFTRNLKREQARSIIYCDYCSIDLELYQASYIIPEQLRSLCDFEKNTFLSYPITIKEGKFVISTNPKTTELDKFNHNRFCSLSCSSMHQKQKKRTPEAIEKSKQRVLKTRIAEIIKRATVEVS